MHTSTWRIWLAGFLAIMALGAGAQVTPGSANAAGKPGVDALAWLAGSWRMERAGRVIDEQWMQPAGGVMLGMSRTVAKGRVVEHEFMQIRPGPGGDLFYIAQPSGQKEAAFQLKSLGATAVVFENPGHDFPQTIAYALTADGGLQAVIAGPGSDGSPRRIEFLYRRFAPPN